MELGKVPESGEDAGSEKGIAAETFVLVCKFKFVLRCDFTSLLVCEFKCMYGGGGTFARSHGCQQDEVT